MSQKFTICLNMIVKNENHIIKETFDNLLKYFKFDYWIISDTGSTDGTQDFIINYFTEKNIEGELFEDEWKDFSFNRNLALQYAYNKTDYLLFFDADDLIHGDFKLPNNLDKDVYYVNFTCGNENTLFNRISIINNRKYIGKYIGVLHEVFDIDNNLLIEHINGDYHFQTRHLGNRSKNVNKYEDDAKILEIAIENEYDENLKNRYIYYCGQSYQSANILDKSNIWFEKFLNLNTDNQYKYCACINLGHNYKNIKKELSLYYYAKSYDYDKERIEGITYLMDYYYNKDLHIMINSLWEKFKNYKVLNSNNKIFLNKDRYKWFEWYNIISGFYTNNSESAYESCRRSIINNYNIPNVIQNLIFYKKQYDNDNDNIVKEFLYNYIKNNNDIDNFNKYSEFIKNYNNEKYEFLYNFFFSNNIDKSDFYKNSNKILIYTGNMNFLWNDTTLKEKSIGGSEKAVIYLSRNLPKNYEIYIAGDQLEEKIDNITYIHHNNLQYLLNNNSFHTIIVSRYVSFFEQYKNIKCAQLVVSAHDSTGFINFINNNSINNILKKNNKFIDFIISLTKWHKNNIIEKHSFLKDKIKIINNGINIEEFDNKNIKIKNKFVWSSCAYRGLKVILNLWPKILEIIPDATLDICSYDNFPKNKEEEKMLEIINSYSSITYLGKLNTYDLYKLFSKSEYWLYTNTFPETSCITAMEMLMCEVICIYYPLAGLNDTLGEYGIKVKEGTEIETLINLSEEKKTILKKKGKEYALKCSWENRAKEWCNVLKLNKNKWIFYCSPYFETKMIDEYIKNLNNIYPEYYIYLTNNKNIILKENPYKVTFVFEIFDKNILSKLPNTEFSFFNTEPLNIPIRLENVINILKLYHNLEYYDYSKSNLEILQENEINIQDKIYLPYKCNSDEVKKLTALNKNTKKEFDFGILKASNFSIIDRRLKIINFLKKNNFSVNIIEGWGDDRDLELAKCKIILNVHGNLNTVVSNIFEHIRCDRLLQAGFNILSEDSYKLSNIFIEKYPNLKLISYDTFFNINKIIEYYNNKLSTKNHNNYVLNILKDTHTRIDIPQVHINFLKELKEHLNDNNMIIYDIGSSVLHWTEHASKIWNNSKIYLFDGMTEMKLFYDEYNKKNNTNYDYNIVVLCDEDYKRINFYQNDELSGGNSYYKEVGHPNSANIFTEGHIKHKVGMKLETVVKNKNIPMPDLVKIDVQGAELDILKGSMNIINNAKFLIVELQHTEYNLGAPLCNQTRDFLIENGWKVYAEKFSNNGPDADWCFVNTRYNDFTEIKNIYDTLCLNKNPFNYYLNPIDIYEHLPTLYRYTNECESILECGVRDEISSWAFVYGLLNNNSHNKKLILNDIQPCNIDTLQEKTKNINLDIEFKWINNLDLVLNKNVDMTFIDTCHVGGHLKKKLAKFSKLTNKYIIMHDTTIDEFTSEAIRANLTEEQIKEQAISSSMSIDDIKMGLWPAIDDFLNNNNEWVLHKRFTNNNGLTILKKVSNQPKIIDCFTFYNEIDLLTYRLNILNDVVDYFIIVEATHTFIGKEKPLFYEENKHIFEKFNNKIIHIVVNDLPHKYPNINIKNEEQWVNERFQRDCISRGLNKLSLQNNDVITITDVDEIPNPKLLKNIKNTKIIVDINILELNFYYYNLNSKIDDQWHHSKILTFQKYNELNITCNNIRFYSCQIIKNAGWHLSYFGNVNFIKNKLQNFSHQEYNKIEFIDEKKIEERIKNSKDLFDRSTRIINISIEDNNDLPTDYNIYLTNFYKK